MASADKSNSTPPGGKTPDSLFSRGGDMSARMRAFDWDSTPLGSPSQWPQSLRAIVRVMLTSRYAMWMAWGPDLIFFCNDAYRPTLGVKDSWAMGTSARKVWAEIWPDIGPRIDHVLKTGEATWDEGLLLILERSGFPEETYHTFSYSPLSDDSGDIAGMLCVVTEETERFIGERRLNVMRNLSQRLASSNSEKDVFASISACLQTENHDLPFTLVYTTDEDSDLATLAMSTGVSPGAAVSPPRLDSASSTAPWPLQEVFSRRSSTLVTDLQSLFPSLPPGPWPRPPNAALLVPIAQQGQGKPAGVFIAGLNPYRRPDEAYLSFVDLFVGQIAAGLANAHAYDTQRLRAESLAQIDRAKTTFFSNVSHEFRTPLTLMLGPIEDMLADTSLDPTRHDQLNLVYRNGLRLLKLVNTLLDFSRIEAGRVKAVYQPTDLAVYTAELASVFRSAIEKAGLIFTVQVQQNDSPAYVDRDMWEKIVLNLLSNAFKFTHQGHISLKLNLEANRFVLQVEDTGVGVPEDEIHRLFERFHRVEGAKGRTHEGTGIGLALVQELVHLHGGEISAVSELGRGTTFTVTIPTGKAHLDSSQIQQTPAPTSSSAGFNPYVAEALRWLPDSKAQDLTVDARTTANSLVGSPQPNTPASTRRERILLADDNADMREYVTRLLGDRYELQSVADGESALITAAAWHPVLILSDVMMPRLDGFGLIRAVRADPELASIPVILLSARAGEEATVEGMKAGADDYIVKPFSARELMARVDRQIERKRFEKTIEAAEQRFQSALVAARMSAWEWDPVADEVHASATASEVYGLLPTETLQNSAQGFRLVHPDDLPRHRALVNHAAQNCEGFHSEFRIIRPVDGQIAWLEERGSARRDAETGQVRMSGLVLDITDRKLAEQKQEEILTTERTARAEAERVSRMKDEFLATLSHELRTPLNAILGWSQLLNRGALDPEDARQGLDAIERNARSQTQMIEDLLDMNRIISGKLRLDVQRVMLADVVDQAVQSALPAANAKTIKLLKVIDPNAGPIAGDPARLQQVFWNLLTNAIKFTPKQGKIQIVLERINSHLEVSVSDNGEGIETEFLPHVFERFRQADASTTRRHGGLGLGLNIVKQIVEMHGGTVRVSSPGKGMGSTFTVALPVAIAKQDDDNNTGERRHPSAVGGASVPMDNFDLNGVSVLVVDDDADARELMRRILSEHGASITTAGSVAEALAIMVQNAPQLLISDIGMPGEDGYELIRKVRSLPAKSGAKTPAVALTAFARSEDRQRALRAGYQMHVAKPVEPSELLTVCLSLVDRER